MIAYSIGRIQVPQARETPQSMIRETNHGNRSIYRHSDNVGNYQDRVSYSSGIVVVSLSDSCIVRLSKQGMKSGPARGESNDLLDAHT